MNFLKIADILGILNNCIDYKLPFSHIRFGDGGLKFIHSLLEKDVNQLTMIIEKEGLPSHKLVEIFELWGYYARRATCIDTPQVYFIVDRIITNPEFSVMLDGGSTVSPA